MPSEAAQEVTGKPEWNSKAIHGCGGDLTVAEMVVCLGRVQTT